MKSESIVKLAEALSKAQGEMPAAQMNSTNPFLKNKYADLGSIIKAAQPVLEKHGLAISQMTESDNGNIGITTMLMHASGEYIGSTITLPLGESKGISQAQAAGAIITYLRRYSYAAILGMYADEDTDGNQAKATNQKAAQPKAEQAQVDEAVNIYQVIVDANLSQNVHSAKNTLNKCKTGYDTPEKAIAWMKVYRAERDTGANSQEAADKANS